MIKARTSGGKRSQGSIGDIGSMFLERSWMMMMMMMTDISRKRMVKLRLLYMNEKIQIRDC